MIHAPDDSHTIRCPRLGHQIHFSYCRQENTGLPCPRTLDCWHTHFDVVGYLQQELSAAEWHDCFATPPRPRLDSLMDLINEALRKAGRDS